jgi:hypothetical protein
MHEKGNKESRVRDSRQNCRWIFIFECAHASENGKANKDPDQQEALSAFEPFLNLSCAVHLTRSRVEKPVFKGGENPV